MPVKETHLNAPVYDQLRHAMASDAAGFLALYREYLTEAWRSLHAIRASIEDGTAELVRAKAHYLRSSSLVLGAHKVARCAAELEEAAIASDAKLFDALLARLETALKGVQVELSKRLGTDVFPAKETAA